MTREMMRHYVVQGNMMQHTVRCTVSYAHDVMLMLTPPIHTRRASISRNLYEDMLYQSCSVVPSLKKLVELPMYVVFTYMLHTHTITRKLAL